INDSIVLVTTIDEYAEERGLIPAIIDGTCDRLRPVLLTTLTTVLGLAPLLYEGSADAQFLKPTVITLVYGLGFGMVIVLLVVPAILAMQQDFAKQFTALRRATGTLTRHPAMGFGLGALAVALAALFAATLGSALATGGMIGPLAGLGTGIGPAFGVFLAGAALLCVLGWTVAAALYLVSRRSA
ncbi:MAG: efflux RND transporter permease subunit, partial [Roseicyclus sp.]|nr:efflux RND transporter permease subunit [Roseicyclus sp.]